MYICVSICNVHMCSIYVIFELCVKYFLYFCSVCNFTCRVHNVNVTTLHTYHIKVLVMQNTIQSVLVLNYINYNK